jgi:hypothetical protein
LTIFQQSRRLLFRHHPIGVQHLVTGPGTRRGIDHSRRDETVVRFIVEEKNSSAGPILRVACTPASAGTCARRRQAIC